MSFAQDAGDLLLRCRHLARGERAGEHVPDVHVALESRLRGGVRHHDDIVLVTTAAAPTLRLHDTNYRERDSADLDTRANRIAPDPQLPRHRRAEQRDLAAGSHVRVGEDLARARVPVTDLVKIRSHAD